MGFNLIPFSCLALVLCGCTSTKQPIEISNPQNRDFNFNQMKIRFQPPPPPYPQQAKINRITGKVVVLVIIDKMGVPFMAKAIDGPQELREAAVFYAMQWRFEPATLNGVPVNAKFKLTMPFHLR